METSTSFRQKASTGNLILFAVCLFSTYRFVVAGWQLEHLAIAVASGIASLATIRLIEFEERWQTSTDVAIEMPSWIRPTLLVILGLLSLYLFFYKALYQGYLYWDGLGLRGIVLKVIVAIASYRLVVATSAIQTVILSISKR